MDRPPGNRGPDRRLASPSCTFTFGGAPIAAADGDTIAAALVAAGIMAQGTGKDGGPRGQFCGMGTCHDCLVVVDGRAGLRACLVKVKPGMQVEPEASGCVPLAQARVDLAPVLAPAPDPLRVDVLVVGAGPAGLHTAAAAARAGAGVLVVDERPAPGGQYFKQAAGEGAAPIDGQMREGRDLIRAVRQAGATIRSETMAWGVERDPSGGLSVGLITHGAVSTVRPKLLVIATGAFERPTIVPGWTLPGVMTTGAAQTLLRSHGVAPGRRVLLAGNGPLNLQVAHEAVRCGAEVILAEAAPPPWIRPLTALRLSLQDPGLAFQGLATLARLGRAGVGLYFGHRLSRIEGTGRVERAVLENLGDGGRVRLDVDAVCTGDGFVPACDLVRLLGLPLQSDASGALRVERGDDGSTAQEDVFVVGEAGGFGGAQVAASMGMLAGMTISRRLGLASPSEPVPTRRLERHRRFQSALWALFKAPALPERAEELLVCRCEAVTLSRLRAVATAHGLRDVASLKRMTRAGMGRCQGRYCTPELARIVEAAAPHEAMFAPQVPVRPVPLASLALEKPEWSGHRRVSLPSLQAVGGRAALPREAATVVIGAGIAGLSCALFLARSGHDVLVLDRQPVNAGASGGNAGSLHAQLLSFDHGAKAEAGGGPAARTLPLQRDSIALWQDLQRDVALDMEISVTGGLMVAETEDHLAFLAAKVKVEQAHGIECHIIGANDLRRLEPALDPRFVGAAFCPQEGKINPLVATQAICDAARAAGAAVETGVEVQSIEQRHDGFRVATSCGEVRAGRVVNAAGAFASRVGAMLGTDVPVHGAPLQMVVTEAVEPLVTRLIAHAGRHLTLKQARNGNVIIGGGWTAGLDPVRQHPRPLRDSLEGNLWVAQHVLPALRRLHVLRSWAAMNINIDGAPILGEHPTIRGFYQCVTSNGYTLGPVVGLLTARLIVDGDAGRDLAPFSLSRFRLP